MLAMIRTMGDQLRWAVDLEVPSMKANRDFVVAGMGGSGIGGDFLGAATAPTDLSVYTHKDYAPLPGWVYRVEPVLIGASYSGNTEETLSVVSDATARGLDVAVVTTGGALLEEATRSNWPAIEVPQGYQPRAALGHIFGAALRILGRAAQRDFRPDLAEAADLVDGLLAEGSPGWESAAALAEALAGKTVIVYGGGHLSGAAAQRWKTQINENAKTPSWWSVLPEADHNEIVGWESRENGDGADIGIVALQDSSDHERVRTRYSLTRELTEDVVPWAGMVESTGASAVARLFSLAAMGDLVSYMLATNAGVDPTPVDTIEKLKESLIGDDG